MSSYLEEGTIEMIITTKYFKGFHWMFTESKNSHLLTFSIHLNANEKKPS